MCLAKGHNPVPPVRLKNANPRSRVKHSTTEPLCLQAKSYIHTLKLNNEKAAS